MPPRGMTRDPLYHGGMSSAEELRAAANRWDVAVPSGSGRLRGVSMAGFRDRTTKPVDLGVVPYPAVTVIVDLSDGQILVDDVNGRPPSGSIVLGLAPGVVRGGGQDIELLQMRLSPLVAHAVFGGCSQIGGAVVDLNDLWGRDGSRLQDQLRATASWDDRFAIAELALARRLETGPTVNPEVGYVWTQLMTNRGQVRVDQLAAEVGWSRKRLWSRYRAQIGLTPKRAAQLIRFDHAVHRLAAGQSVALVASEAGYFDQSHLHRDVMAFVGMTPSGVSLAPWLAVDDVAWGAPEHLSRSWRQPISVNADRVGGRQR